MGFLQTKIVKFVQVKSLKGYGYTYSDPEDKFILNIHLHFLKLKKLESVWSSQVPDTCIIMSWDTCCYIHVETHCMVEIGGSL